MSEIIGVHFHSVYRCVIPSKDNASIMGERPSDKQSLHDQVEADYADELDGDGWKVFADDVGPYGSPSAKNGRIPDISATKGGNHLIVEIETDKTDDAGQRRAFKQWARGSTRREYRGVLAKTDGSWTKFETA